MNYKLFLILTLTLLTPQAWAEVSDEDFEELRQQLAAVSARLEQLAAENAELKRAQADNAGAVAQVQTEVAEVQSSGGSSEANWTDRIRMDGDFRYRYETIDVENSDRRNRNRIRARANIKSDLTDDVEIGFGLATGGDDPVSTNQTLGSGGSSKNVVLNLAYADWEAVDGLHLIAGKYKNPQYRVGKQALMFDGDWTPEGLALRYEKDWFFVNAIGSWLESDSRKDNDTFSWGGQFGATGQFGDFELLGGLAYYSIKTKGKTTTFGDPSDPGDFFGNSSIEIGGDACGTTGADCVYLYDFLMTQVFAEAKFDIGDWPVVVFADYVHNSDAPSNNDAWTFGGRFGQTKDRGQMEFSYFYADKGADSMLGLITDSDFGGGGTDNRGHFLKFMYGVNKTWSVGAQYFINEIDVSTGNKRDYNRLMIDTQWKWK